MEIDWDFFFSISLNYIVLCNICAICVIFWKGNEVKAQEMLKFNGKRQMFDRYKEKIKTIPIWFESKAFRGIQVLSEGKKSTQQKIAIIIFIWGKNQNKNQYLRHFLFSLLYTKKVKKYRFLSVHPLRLLYWLHL